MKLLLLIACFLLCQSSFAQYKVDTSVRAEYMYLFKKLNKESKIEKNRQFRNGLGILIGSKTDTLNKNDFETLDTSFKIKTINPEPNEPELSPTLSHPKTISIEPPTRLNCSCKFKRDTLEIGVGLSLFSGFAIVTRLNKIKAMATYYEYESEGKVLRADLTSKKSNQIKVPANLNSLILDRKPQKEIKEIYGRATVITSAYYSYINAWGFKDGYIHKRMKFQYYFRCNTTKSKA